MTEISAYLNTHLIRVFLSSQDAYSFIHRVLCSHLRIEQETTNLVVIQS